jgi:hypothetical protein
VSTPEHSEQVAFVRWFRATFPSVLIYAIPNGEKRSVAIGKKLKDEGVVAGIPDLHVPAWRLRIEMKRADGGRVSVEQAEVMDYLQTVGETCLLCHGCDDARKQVQEFLTVRQRADSV